MDEFLNRITAQRQVINIVNKSKKFDFPLVGLSAKSIERWKKENYVNEKSEIIVFLYLISAKLFFLANKSQEQITNEYKLLSSTISELIKKLDDQINR